MGNHRGTLALTAALALMWLASFALAAWRPVPAAARPGAFALTAAVSVLAGVRQMLRPGSGRHSAAGMEHDNARRLDAYEAALIATIEAAGIEPRGVGPRRHLRAVGDGRRVR
jgi:hypothetical protein